MWGAEFRDGRGGRPPWEAEMEGCQTFLSISQTLHFGSALSTSTFQHYYYSTTSILRNARIGGKGDVKVFLGILLLWDEQFIPGTKKSEVDVSFAITMVEKG